jgi:hypothetical protein
MRLVQVYKESLEDVIKPSIASLETAMKYYASCGGQSKMFVNDDGLKARATVLVHLQLPLQWSNHTYQ